LLSALKTEKTEERVAFGGKREKQKNQKEREREAEGV
jgi:hypothetical protein